jgi:hypothetical protein
MGDKFGSFVYCLAVHPAYMAIRRRCPNVVIQAATDDIKGFARDPADLCRMFLVAAEELERHAGVCLIEQGQEWHSSPAQRAAAGCQLPPAG